MKQDKKIRIELLDKRKKATRKPKIRKNEWIGKDDRKDRYL